MTKAGNSQIMRTIPLLITIFSLSLPAYAQYSGGKGEPNDPYQIANADDLMLLGDNPNDYNKHFILTDNIDLDPNLPGRKVFDRAVIAPETDDTGDWGFEGSPFTGVFDANGHIISNLKIQGESHLGLFGQLGVGADISNLALEAVLVNGTGDCVGSLVGKNSYGSITANSSSGTVSGNNHVGGLVGYNDFYGNISTSYSTVTVSGIGAIGGLVGSNREGSSIANSYSTGTVSGDWEVGGLVGWNNGGSVSNSYSTGAVTGVGDVGGLVGLNYGSVSHCYSTGKVTGDPNSVGGLVGTMNYRGSVSNSFWDIDTSDLDKKGSGTGLTTVQMQDMDTFLRAGWDLADEISNGTCDYWKISSGDYPQLRYHASDGPVMPEGLGMAEQPYLIQDARDLGAAWFEPMAHYRLEASIDLSGITWSMAVVPWFGGTLDGNGHVISNLHIQGGNRLGLFGQLGSEAMISNLGMTAVDVIGTGNDVGGLAGDNSGRVFNSYSTGEVTGDWKVGGLVGWNNGGSVSNSYSTGAVTGVGDVGGLVGFNYGSVSNCYSTDKVTGGDDVGGLVGKNIGSVSNCYSTCKVTGEDDVGGLVGNNYGSVYKSFWDIDTSELNKRGGGTGLTTVQMQDMDTFLSAGWDLADEISNGTCDYWQISSGDYPQLRYHASDGPVMPEGLGTAQQPYLIRNALDLGTVWFKPHAHYRLESLVDLSGIIWSMAVVPWFGGTLDGNGHVISNLHIQGGNRSGLFGQLGSEAMISNLGLTAVDVMGRRMAGGLVGWNNGKLSNCYSTGEVTGTGTDTRTLGGLVGVNGGGGSVSNSYSTSTIRGDWTVGGLVGANEGSVSDSYNTGVVNGYNSVGGLVGVNNGGNISDSYNTDVVLGHNSVGGLVGVNDGGSIYNSYNTGEVDGASNVGGLLGMNDKGSVYSSYSTGAITGGYNSSRLGGLVGWNDGGSVSNSYSASTITGWSVVGGLVGANDSGSVSNSYSTGAIKGYRDDVGGLVGVNGGSISKSFNTGVVDGFNSVGGLVGVNDGGIISNSYNTGEVEGNKYVGGLVGWYEWGSIYNSYNASVVDGEKNVGGLVGWHKSGSIFNSFWNIETSGLTTSARDTGITTVEMQMASTFLEAGWDFIDETPNGTDDIWWILEGQDYPRLWWEAE